MPERLHDWDRPGFCVRCGIYWSSLGRKDPCPGKPNEKEAPKVEPIDDWMEDALNQVAPKANPEELYHSPVRKLTKMDTSSKENLELAMQVVADVNTMASELGVEQAAPDNVVLPKHYARFKIEPIRFCIENGLNGFQFNIIKYVLRHDAKNGLEDLRKARRYLDMFIKYVEGDPDWWR